jgi:hypothetical protein
MSDNNEGGKVVSLTTACKERLQPMRRRDSCMPDTRFLACFGTAAMLSLALSIRSIAGR